MRITGILASFGFLLSLSCVHTEVSQKTDLPWEKVTAGVEREVKAAATPFEARAAAIAELNRLAPDYLPRLRSEGESSTALKKLWGRSINFDEGAKAIIVPEPVLDLVLETAGVPAREGRLAHAGFEHTYGYLLSNLVTPYGYKRLRWIRPDIERGFGLAEGTIVPLPRDGGLFANISVFAGRIAFRGEAPGDLRAMEVLRADRSASSAVRDYDYTSLHGRRLTETLSLPGASLDEPTRIVEIRTDFVPFSKERGETTGGNTELLIYSISDSAAAFPYLISAFPIAPGFSDGATAPSGLGADLPIITRYNAYVSGVTDSSAPLRGTRSVSSF